MAVIKWLDEHLEEVVIVVALIVLSTLTSLNVVLRYIFNASLTWSEEVCKLCLIVSGFFSIAYCVRRGLMIRVEAFIELLGKRTRFVLEMLVSLLLCFFLVVAFIASIRVISSVRASGQLSAALRIPVYWIYLIPAVGFALGVARLVQRTVERFGELARFQHSNPK